LGGETYTITRSSRNKRDYNKGICYSNQSSLQQERTHNITGDGIAVLVGRTVVWEHDTLLVRQELMTNQYFIGIDTDK
jgi:hypothetical protein